MDGEELLGTEPLFFDQRIIVKPAGKNLAGVTAHGIVGLGASQGGGGAHADQPVAKAVEAIPQPADEAGQVGSLGPVEGVELIHHQVPQYAGAVSLWGVVLPEALHVRLQKQIIKLLVVGEQNVGWRFVERGFIGDDAVGCHCRGGVVIGRTDVEACAQACEGRGGVDQFCNAPGLVRGQGIHRVDEDRLDAFAALAVLLATVLQHRQQEALGFTGACAGGDKGIAWAAGQQPLEGFFLMPIGREA